MFSIIFSGANVLRACSKVLRSCIKKIIKISFTNNSPTHGFRIMVISRLAHKSDLGILNPNHAHDSIWKRERESPNHRLGFGCAQSILWFDWPFSPINFKSFFLLKSVSLFYCFSGALMQFVTNFKASWKIILEILGGK